MVFRSPRTVTTEDVTLTERDIFEELQEAMNKAYELGLMLKLLPHEVDAIRKTHPDPRELLLLVILAFLRRAEPRPTWRVIVDALRSPIVNLTALAERVEAAHFPDPTATRPQPPATGESVTRQSMRHIVIVVAITTGPSSPDCIPPQTPPVDSGELIILYRSLHYVCIYIILCSHCNIE